MIFQFKPFAFNYLPSGNCDFLHCKDKMPKIWNKYSQKRNIGASVPISTFMCLWTNYIFPRWVCLLCWRKYVDRFWEYINSSQTHECGNWGWGRAIPRKGKRNCRCSVNASLGSKTAFWKRCFGVKIPALWSRSSTRSLLLNVTIHSKNAVQKFSKTISAHTKST